MDQRKSSELPGRNSYVRNLKGHSYDKGKIGKIKEVGFGVIGEFKSPVLLLPGITAAFRRSVVKMGIAQREDGMYENPRAYDAGKGKNKMNGQLRPRGRLSSIVQQEQDRKKTHKRGSNDKKVNQDTVRILPVHLLPNFRGMRAEYGYPGQPQMRRAVHEPTDHPIDRLFHNRTGHNCRQRAENQRNTQLVMGIQSVNKSDSLHRVWGHIFKRQDSILPSNQTKAA